MINDIVVIRMNASSLKRTGKTDDEVISEMNIILVPNQDEVFRLDNLQS